jgi:hypothetical protein
MSQVQTELAEILERMRKRAERYAIQLRKNGEPHAATALEAVKDVFYQEILTLEGRLKPQ